MACMYIFGTCTTVTIHGFTGEMTKIFILYDGHSNLILFHMSYYATVGALNSEHCGPSYPQNKDIPVQSGNF